MTEHGEPFAASQLAAHIREKYTGHYAAWERDDSTCIVRALRRHADTGLIGFDGLHVGIGPAMTRDYVRAYSEAYRAEGERQMAEAEALERVSDALAATGCSTLREYRERFGHEPQ